MKRVYGAGNNSLITPKKNAFLFPNDGCWISSGSSGTSSRIYRKKSKIFALSVLIKNKGMKAKNIYKKEKEANLKKLMEITEGKLHENEDIDIEDMGGLVDDVENINYR